MQILFQDKNVEKSIQFENNVVLYGPNNLEKSNILSILKEGFCGNSPNFFVNNLPVKKNEFSVIFFDDTTDFNEQFKFNKNNVFRAMIYDEILDKINEESVLEHVNEIFDIIDQKVNKTLNRKINKFSNQNIRFDININNISTIIEKFTDIYINDYLLNKEITSKPEKRKLLYNLLLLNLANQEKTTVVLIDQFDIYLSIEETLEIIQLLNHQQNKKIHFILSTSNPLYPYFYPLKSFSNIKCIHNKMLKLDNIDFIFERYLLRKEFKNQQKFQEFDDFIEQNKYFLTTEEIKKCKESFLPILLPSIAFLLNVSTIKITNTFLEQTKIPFIIYHTEEEKLLLEEFAYYLLDKE